MGIFINRGNSSFASAVKSKIYVDKTGMLEYMNSVIETEQRYICVSRPRRFGKSITAGMLTAYYGKGCDSRPLFEPLAVSKIPSFEEQLNRYDVIHLDIAYLFVQMPSPLEVISYIHKIVIEELKEIYPDILTEEDRTLPTALSKIHYAAGAKFIVVIDEWDVIFREAKEDKEAQQAYISLLRGLFKGEQSKDFISLAYITGILPIKKYKSESALNNFDEFTMINADMLAEYVGFTEQEVKSLCEEYGMDFSEMKRWYDGYRLDNSVHVYNPKSVTDAIRRKKIANYWTNTVAYESLKDYISMNFDGLRDSIVQMIAGESCRINTNTFENDLTSFKSRDDVLTVLIHLGYLTYNNDTQEARIPNEEVRTAFTNAVQGTDWTPVVQAIQKSEELLRATWDRDADAVARQVEEVHMANTSILSYNNENSLSCVIALAYYQAVNEYVLIREMPSGKGFADLVFLPRKHSMRPAMIVELKYNRTADSALAQIRERRYAQALEEYCGTVLLVGISYDEVTKQHDCVIEEWQKEEVS